MWMSPLLTKYFGFGSNFYVFSQGPVRHCPRFDCGTLLLQEEIARIQIRFQNKRHIIFCVECENKTFWIIWILFDFAFLPSQKQVIVFHLYVFKENSFSSFSHQRFDLNRKFEMDLASKLFFSFKITNVQFPVSGVGYGCQKRALPPFLLSLFFMVTSLIARRRTNRKICLPDILFPFFNELQIMGFLFPGVNGK